MKIFLLAVIAVSSISAFAGNIETCNIAANQAVLESISKSNKLTEEQELEFYFTTLAVFDQNPELIRKVDSVVKEYCAAVDAAAASVK